MSTPFEKIYKMNVLIGHKSVKPNTDEFWSQIRNQIERVVEEAEETLNAGLDEDPEKFLDGVCDILVTGIGLYQKAIMCGYPASEALDRVCDNNLTKFHKTAEDANETVQFYRDQGVETFVRLSVLPQTEGGVFYYSVIRKEDGKLLKPKNFLSVDLKDLIEKVQEIAENWEETNESTKA